MARTAAPRDPAELVVDLQNDIEDVSFRIGVAQQMVSKAQKRVRALMKAMAAPEVKTP